MSPMRDSIRTAGWVRGIKTPVQRALRKVGYELTPVHASYSELVTELARHIDYLVDVGANQGQYATKFRDLGYTGRMHSFEPLDAAYTRLRARADHDPLWQVTQAAVGAQEGELSMNISANSVSSSVLEVTPTHVRAETTSRVTGTQVVPVVTLDDVLDEVEASSIWLKIDVQGYEGQVLEGAPRTLERVAVLQTEVSFSELYEGQVHYLDLLTRCRDAGLDPVYVEPGFIDPSTGSMLQCDFVCARRRKVFA